MFFFSSMLNTQQINISPSLCVTMVLLQHLEQGICPITRRCYSPNVYSTTMGRNLFTNATTSNKLFSRGSSALKPKLKTESKQVAARKHSDAERRRRSRINCQYATLRTILPNLVKHDKASVLVETIKHFNELKKMIKDVPTIPALEDNLRLSPCNNRDMARVVFSCSDRKGLMTEVAQSMKTVNAKSLRAELMTVGGRTKCALFIQGVNGNEGLIRLKKSLKHVVNSGNSSSSEEEKSNNNL